MAVMFLFLVPPIGYGWGYRGWGPPYPRYIQRRRGERAVAGPAGVAGAPGVAGVAAPGFNHRSWGWGGDVVWMVVLLGMFWAVIGIWWR